MFSGSCHALGLRKVAVPDLAVDHADVFRPFLALGLIGTDDVVEGVGLGIEVVDVREDDGFEGFGDDGGAHFEFAVVRQNHVQELRAQVLREVFDGVHFSVGDGATNFEVAKQFPDGGVVDVHALGELFGFTDVVEENPGDEQIA